MKLAPRYLIKSPEQLIAGEEGFEPGPAEPTKRCPRCGEVKSLDQFYRRSRSPSGRNSWCKDCHNKASTDWRKKNHARAASTAHRRYLRLGDKIRRYNVELHQRYKALLVAHYSNGANKCVCCGESEVRFLTIDHINGNGSEHRKLTKCGTGSVFYCWLIREGMPEGYQVLCYNCNNARARHGICPHQLGGKQ